MKREEIRPGMRLAWQPPTGAPIPAEVLRVPRRADRHAVIVLLRLPDGRQIDRLVMPDSLQALQEGA